MGNNFFQFEGSDGSGKTTVVAALRNRLATMLPSKNVIITREPGGAGLSDEPVLASIRSIVKSGLNMDPLCELMLFMADRAQHREMVVKPAIARGDFILQDRGFISSIAYQHYGRGQPLELIEQLNALTMSGVMPRKIFWIDTTLDLALSRIKQRADSFEGRDLQARVHNGYKVIYHSAKYPMFWVNGNQPVEKIVDDIVAEIMWDENEE